MNNALDILETNILYRHLILYHLYIEHKGVINNNYSDLRKDLKKLFGEEFSLEHFNAANNYLINKGYTKNSSHTMTISGVDYFENYLEEFSKTDIEDQEILEKKLPKKVFDFFKFSSKTNTVLSLINNLIKLDHNQI